MSIQLTPEQEKLVQRKLQAGNYHSAEELLDIALRLLDEFDRAEAAWVEDVRSKIDAAVEASKHTAPIDGEVFVSGVLERY